MHVRALQQEESLQSYPAIHMPDRIKRTRVVLQSLLVLVSDEDYLIVSSTFIKSLVHCQLQI